MPDLIVLDPDDTVAVLSFRAEAAVPKSQPSSFQRYVRADGRVGTRNYIALCATENSSATVIKRAASEIEAEGALDPYPHVDGIAAYGCGCGIAATGRGTEIFGATLRVASGERTKSESLGLGGNAFQPWQIGEVM